MAQKEGKRISFCAAILYSECIILPRQARDKHREKHSKQTRFCRPPPAEFGEAEEGAAAMLASRFRSKMVRRTPFLSQLHMNTIVLPRQARDKHRTTLRKSLAVCRHAGSSRRARRRNRRGSSRSGGGRCGTRPRRRARRRSGRCSRA